MKKQPKPDNVSNAFLIQQAWDKLAVFLREAYAEGRAKGLTPSQVTAILMKSLDEFTADQESQ